MVKTNRKPECHTSHACVTLARAYYGETGFYLASMDRRAADELVNDQVQIKIAPIGIYLVTDETPVIIRSTGGAVEPADKYSSPFATPRAAWTANPTGTQIGEAPAGGWRCVGRRSEHPEVEYFQIRIGEPTDSDNKYEFLAAKVRLPRFGDGHSDPWA